MKRALIILVMTALVLSVVVVSAAGEIKGRVEQWDADKGELLVKDKRHRMVWVLQCTMSRKHWPRVRARKGAKARMLVSEKGKRVDVWLGFALDPLPGKKKPIETAGFVAFRLVELRLK